MAPYSGTSSLCLDLLRAHWPEDLAALAAPLALRLHLVRGDADGAAETARQPGPWRGFPLFEQAAAHALLLTGRRDEVLSRLAGLVRAHPWNTQAVLKLHDLLGQEDRQRAPLDGTCGVLLFSCNKADDLRATLGSLAESEAASLPVRVLDNGSTDGTRDMLDGFAASGRLPGLSPLHLPVNIGAPAARDWLLSLPEVRDLDYVAFLDDDVDLPPDWLSRLGAAVAAYPGASVWGCKVAEFDRPGLAQAADLTLLPGEGEAPFAVSDLHLQGPDLGRFQYLRPCISVMGCCHLFRTADLIASGGFDIRFSPTQFDDLDRDLSAALAGKPAVYQGFLPVAHRKRSGGQVRDEAAGGNARGNQTKLFAKHGPRAGELFHSQRRWLADDLLGKAARLDEDFPG
ncbi:glycosyltransferase family 2 protein [Desulfohalovibrio reitneri]|uniref:glycosyltransferase family 2 protein n=1 Tax=Desulfohalovibrio reitneri TaxID=1307759 RepID=UPI0006893C0B|nr:glycosyltransferase [Desulfohalovibrio reitneri]